MIISHTHKAALICRSLKYFLKTLQKNQDHPPTAQSTCEVESGQLEESLLGQTTGSEQGWQQTTERSTNNISCSTATDPKSCIEMFTSALHIFPLEGKQKNQGKIAAYSREVVGLSYSSQAFLGRRDAIDLLLKQNKL